MIDYSVIIRTTGNANQKYQQLLEAVGQLNPQPKEVIVVLPEENHLPKEQLGKETYYYSPKGMVIQRMHGIAKCKTRYALICDDDVTFPPDFVEKLYKPVKEKGYSFSAGPLYSFLPPKGANAILCAIMASAIPTLFHKNRYVSILRSGGYSYNRNLKKAGYYETQSVAWTCFFADIESIKNLDFEDEYWLDSHGYSSLDDQTMFYKAWIRNMKTVVVADALYEHLDARTSLKNNKNPVLFSLSYNRIVFWHRFIYSQQQNLLLKGWTFFCFKYRSLWLLIFDLLDLARKRLSWDEFRVKREGAVGAYEYIKSAEYKKLNEV
ncbi:glycosyltransferase [Anaerostipes faecalis]|uniref:glycosyltransferase n=1 Tax=Anaerostipes faecalis TaxID=2738446 RepID=UPI003F0B62EF